MKLLTTRFIPASRWGTPIRLAPTATSGAPANSPALLTKIGRLRRELMVWVKAGAPRAPAAVRKERLAICVGCEYYAAAGNLGLGECRFPGCGCTRVKAALATSQCPHRPPKWTAWAPVRVP